MPLHTQEYLDRLIAALDLDAFYREYCDRSGGIARRASPSGWTAARCPFGTHDDHNPSFAFEAATGAFNCLTCADGEGRHGGNPFQFLQRRLRISFPEAVEIIRQRTGTADLDADAVAPPLPTPARQAALEAEHAPPPPIPETVVAAWHDALMASPALVERLREYRLWAPETLTTWQLGIDVRGLGDPRYPMRVTIPIRDEAGTLLNVRRYRVRETPELRGPKFLPYADGYGSTLWPRSSLVAARSTGGAVYLLEGEPDTLLALQDGLLALTGTAGANTFPAAWAAAFEGLDVVVLYDVDQAGRAGASRVVAKLRDAGARSIRNVLLPFGDEAGEGKDYTDWRRTHGAADLAALVDATTPARFPPSLSPLPPPGAAPIEPIEAPTIQAILRAGLPPGVGPTSDFAYAYRFAHQDRETIAAVPGLGWKQWTGAVWATATEETIWHRVSEPGRALDRAARDLADPEQARAMLKLATTMLSAAKVKIGATLAIPLLTIPVERFDADPLVLNCANGELDLRTGTLGAHTRDHYHTKQSPIAYDPDAICLRFLLALDRIFGGNQPLIDWFQEALGYCLTGTTGEQVFFMWYGSGANGKTMLIELLGLVLGDYARTAAFSTFLESRSERTRTDIARLVGARLVHATESDAGRRLDEPTLKNLTGGDSVTARHLYEAEFEYTPQFKVLLASNYKPEIQGQDFAFWRRVRLVPFLVTIPLDDRVRDFHRVLVDAEGPGILAWVAAGAARWLARGRLPRCETVDSATEEYRLESDLVGNFLAEFCDREDPNHYELTSDLFAKFEQSTGVPCPFKMKRFAMELERCGIRKKHLPAGSARQGVRLLERPISNPRNR